MLVDPTTRDLPLIYSAAQEYDAFSAAGPLRADYDAVNWSETPLGPVEGWPQSLRTSLSICLASRFPMLVLWGPELIMLYNEGYLPVPGLKHPMALGLPCATVWPEVWDFIGPMLKGVLDGGPATYSEDQLLLLERQGFPEECYFTFSYSPILDESGAPGGIFTAVTETTRRILGARRVEVVRQLGEKLADPSEIDASSVIAEALAVLDRNPHDVLESGLYERHENDRWQCEGVELLPAIDPIAQGELRIAATADALRLVKTAAGHVALVAVPVGVGRNRVLACRLNPQLPTDDDLFGFLTLAARTIGAGLSTAASWAAERQREHEEVAAAQKLALQERRVAEILQRSLLPVLPRIPDLDIAARYAPGDSDIEVGGDWYDIIDLGVGRTGIVIGDVMGRGVAAAAIMGQLRAAVRAYAQLDLSPADVLGLLDLVVDQLGETNFVTCLYGAYDPADRTLTMANAGHFAPLAIGASDADAASLAVPPEPPLGSGPSEYRNHSIVLTPGMVLALFTDGLVESRGHDIDDGLRALGQVLSQGREQPLEELADQVLADMDLHHPHDDDTALVLLRVPAGQSAGQGPRAVVAWAVEPRSDAVPHARNKVEQTCQQWGLRQATIDAACLTVSELLTNAIRHGASPLHVRLRATDTALYVEVSDASTYRPRRRVAGPDDENGRGLLLVEEFARRCGTRPRAAGKVVWAELDL